MQIITNQTEQKNGLTNNLPENLLCFSHLRWYFVFQRPQQLLTRLAKYFHIFFLEEPIEYSTDAAHYTYYKRGNNITVVVPHVPQGLSQLQLKSTLKNLFDAFMQPKIADDFMFWYYTPMALEFSRKHIPKLSIFDCMDELSAFKFAPEELKLLEKELLQKVDVVFTGGQSLYEAKKKQHDHIYPFPSSIDQSHFLKARSINNCPEDQVSGNPKIGFFGVIDERFDTELIKKIADRRPDWQIILIGPVVKIDSESLPKNKNIHYLGQKTYQQLPDYMATWSVALIPFLLNESTKYISPTKTPEYLAAGIPVVSTPITDVANPYGNNGLVTIASNADEFIKAIDTALNSTSKNNWLTQVDEFLSYNSWDQTCEAMMDLIAEAHNRNQVLLTTKAQANV